MTKNNLFMSKIVCMQKKPTIWINGCLQYRELKFIDFKNPLVKTYNFDGETSSEN